MRANAIFGLSVVDWAGWGHAGNRFRHALVGRWSLHPALRDLPFLSASAGRDEGLPSVHPLSRGVPAKLPVRGPRFRLPPGAQKNRKHIRTQHDLERIRGSVRFSKLHFWDHSDCLFQGALDGTGCSVPGFVCAGECGDSRFDLDRFLRHWIGGKAYL